MKKINGIGFLVLLLITAGCTNTPHPVTGGLISNPDEYISTPYENTRVQSLECFHRNGQRNIAIFFDGTANEEGSGTNIFKIHNLATMQHTQNGCPRNYVLYVKGVGTEGSAIKRAIGQATGHGIGEDVRQAYRYVATYYRGKQDNLYIFGFSRGATAARILTSFLDTAGIPGSLPSGQDNVTDLISDLYSLYKGNETREFKKASIAKRLNGVSQTDAQISFLGLFDTVSALGVTHFGEARAQLNPHYSDTLCSVKHVAHAISIDDNRSKMFTPALLHKGLLDSCPNRIEDFDDFVDQVWFAGAHADVGGGYLDTDLSNVPLNWMISRLKYADLALACHRGKGSHLPLIENAHKPYDDYLGVSHDAESHMWFAGNWNRDWPNFLDPDSKKGVNANISAPLLHQSVVARLKERPKACRDFDWINEPGGNKTTNYPACFEKIYMDFEREELERLGSCTNKLAIRRPYVLRLKGAEELISTDACPKVWQPKEFICRQHQ